MNENKLPDLLETDLDKVIYPHSAMVSEPVEAKPDYDGVFKGSKFIIYISIYSEQPDKDYIINSAIIDLYDKVEPSNRSFKVYDLESQGYYDYINSINLIFEKYNKHLLNFPAGEEYQLKEFLSLVNDWIESEVKTNPVENN